MGQRQGLIQQHYGGEKGSKWAKDQFGSLSCWKISAEMDSVPAGKVRGENIYTYCK